MGDTVSIYQYVVTRTLLPQINAVDMTGMCAARYHMANGVVIGLLIGYAVYRYLKHVPGRILAAPISVISGLLSSADQNPSEYKR